MEGKGSRLSPAVAMMLTPFVLHVLTHLQVLRLPGLQQELPSKHYAG
jgi:hypothetical protein